MPDDVVLLAIGTYTERLPHVDGKGAGIGLVQFDQASGRFDGPVVAAAALCNPSYLAVSRGGERLYAVAEVEERAEAAVHAFALDKAGLRLAPLGSAPVDGRCPCHVGLGEAGKQLYVSNYVSGDFSVFDLDANGVPHLALKIERRGSGPNEARQSEPHGHFAALSPDGRHVYFCDLGTDAIARHPVTNGRVSATSDREIRAAPGDGPRHFVLTPSGRFLAALHELSSTLSLHDLDSGGKEVSRVSTLPDGWSGANTTAALKLHPSGRFLYASNRGLDDVFVAELDESAGALRPIAHHRLAGRTPRELAISPNGRFLLAASQDDDLVEVFAIDGDEGMLGPAGEPLATGTPVCLCFVS